MFCPNCANQIEIEQNFCRFCGLKVSSIVQIVSEQNPDNALLILQKRKELFDKFGNFALVCFGSIGISYLFYKIIYYKMLWFGENAIFWSAVIAFVVFGLLAVFFFNYPKLFINEKLSELKVKMSEATEPETNQIGPETNKLLDEGHFEPASVTENSTELLLVENKTRKLK
jgi:hypothetical protein